MRRSSGDGRPISASKCCVLRLRGGGGLLLRSRERRARSARDHPAEAKGASRAHRPIAAFLGRHYRPEAGAAGSGRRRRGAATITSLGWGEEGQLARGGTSPAVEGGAWLDDAPMAGAARSRRPLRGGGSSLRLLIRPWLDRGLAAFETRQLREAGAAAASCSPGSRSRPSRGGGGRSTTGVRPADGGLQLRLPSATRPSRGRRSRAAAVSRRDRRGLRARAAGRLLRVPCVERRAWLIAAGGRSLVAGAASRGDRPPAYLDCAFATLAELIQGTRVSLDMTTLSPPSAARGCHPTFAGASHPCRTRSPERVQARGLRGLRSAVAAAPHTARW